MSRSAQQGRLSRAHFFGLGLELGLGLGVNAMQCPCGLIVPSTILQVPLSFAVLPGTTCAQSDVANFAHALAALLGVIEVRRLCERIYRCYGLGQGALGVRIGRPFKAPVAVGQFDKEEVFAGGPGWRTGGAHGPAEPGHQHGTANAGQLQKLSSVETVHGDLVFEWHEVRPMPWSWAVAHARSVDPGRAINKLQRPRVLDQIPAITPSRQTLPDRAVRSQANRFLRAVSSLLATVR